MNNTGKTLADGMVAYRQRNYGEAAKIWVALAMRGDIEAQFNLGVLYKDGVGVPQQHTEAIKWLRKAADQGHEYAGLILSVMAGESSDDSPDRGAG